MRSDRPSATAQIVAAGTVLLSRDPEWSSLVPRVSAQVATECLLRCGLLAAGLLRATVSGPGRVLLRAAERVLLPGLVLHHALRKAVIDLAVRSARAIGFDRLITLGAGFDALALRHAGAMQTVEVDHPATQQIKAEAIRDLGLDAPRFVGSDLCEPHEIDALADDGSPSIAVAEGVLMYLHQREVLGLLRRAEALPGPARLVFTFMEPRNQGGFAHASPLIDTWLRAAREPFRWTAWPTQVTAALRKSGFKVLDILGAKELRAHCAIPVPTAVGEYVCIAERDA